MPNQIMRIIDLACIYLLYIAGFHDFKILHLMGKKNILGVVHVNLYNRKDAWYNEFMELTEKQFAK